MNYFFERKGGSKNNKNIEGNITQLSDEGVVYNERYLNGKYNLFKVSINNKDFYIKSINENFIREYKINDIVNFDFYHYENKNYIVEDTLYKKIKPPRNITKNQI